jgi:hypothetical protein
MWRYKDETGYLDFLDRQTVGRDCFPGSPQTLPFQFFDIYKDRDEWLIWLQPTPSWEWRKVWVRQPEADWIPLGVDPVVVADGTLLKLGDAAYGPQMILRLTGCKYATEIRLLWELPIWDREDEEPEEPHLGAASARHTAEGLMWIAWFLTRYRWAAVGAIAVFSIGLLALSAGHIKIPQGTNHDNNTTLRD